MKKIKKLLLSTLGILFFVPHVYALSDVDGVVFEEAIVYLESKGVISGYPDGTFKPLNKINRAEFTKIIIGSLFTKEINTSKTNCFPDVSNQWFAPYICLAKEKGILSGYPDGKFHPEYNINFAESSKIVTKGFNLTIPSPKTGQEWYQPFIDTLSNYGAIPFNVVNPDQKMDRSQVAQIIYSLLNPNLPPKNLTQITTCQWPTLATYDYFKDESKVYYTQAGNYQNYNTKGFPVLESADPVSLKVVACEVLKDKQSVFSLGKKTTLDGASFEMLSSHNFEFGLLYTYGKDKNGVYYFETSQSVPIKGVDVSSFKVLEEGKFNPNGVSWYGFAKDKATGYIEGVAIPGSDGGSFALLGENIAFDKNNTYVFKGELVRIYENLDLSPLSNMSEVDFVNKNDAFFENLNYETYQKTEVIRGEGENLTLEWYKSQ